MISSRVKIWSIREKAHLVIHWYLYDKSQYQIIISIYGKIWNSCNLFQNWERVYPCSLPIGLQIFLRKKHWARNHISLQMAHYLIIWAMDWVKLNELMIISWIEEEIALCIALSANERLGENDFLSLLRVAMGVNANLQMKLSTLLFQSVLNRFSSFLIWWCVSRRQRASAILPCSL